MKKGDSSMPKIKPWNILLAGLMLFFLPFAQLKCGSATLAENTGFGMATGNDWKISLGDYEKLLDTDEKKPGRSERSIPNQVNWFLALSILFALGGIIISISSWRHKSLWTMSASILAALLLLAAMIYLKVSFGSEMRSSKQPTERFSGMIKLQFTIWYFLSLFSFSLASFMAYRLHRQELQDAIDRSLDFEFQQSEKHGDS